MNKIKRGFTLVELLVVIGILGILMGALIPAISGALLSSDASAMGMRGGKLVKAIVASNVESKDGEVWPRTTSQEGADSDSIASKTFGTSTEYFIKLFDIDNYGSADRKACVDCDLDVLWGAGVTPMSGTTLQKNNVGWSILAGVETSMEDFIPFLVSRNADVSSFPVGAGVHTMSTQKDTINMGKTYSTPFGNKIMVVVTKGSSASSYKPRDAKLNLVYGNQTFVVPESVTLKYLEP